MLVQVDDASLLRLRVGHHRPKLRDPKDLVARSHSRLQEENGTVGVQLDHQRDEREDRRQDAEPDRRCHDVHRPLEELGRSIEAWRAHAHKRNAFDRVNVDDGTDHVEEPRDDVDLDVLVVELADEPNRCLVVLTREREDHSLDVQKRDEIEQVAGIAEEREVLEARLALLGIGIDEADLSESFIRASGPGGQNVNKVASAVQLRYLLDGARPLPEPVRARLAKLAGSRLTEDGEIVITAQRFRSQIRNREDALDRLLALIRRAATPPTPRRPTRPGRAARERRLTDKARRARRKRKSQGGIGSRKPISSSDLSV